MKRALKITLYAVGALALVAAGLALYGSTQPRDHVASRTVEVARAPADVFAILEDVDSFSCWRTGVERVQRLDGGRFVEHTGDGAVTYAVEAREAPARLVVRIADEDLPYGGAWTYELRPTEGGTELTITERGFIDNTLVRGLAALMMDPYASIDRFQADLQAHREC